MFKLIAPALIAIAALSAQETSMSCKNQGSNGKPSFCEVRETTMASLPALLVDGKQNGGISVKGANRTDILVRAMVQARGDSDSEARSLGSQIVVHTSAGRVLADGPNDKNWSVSYEIFVPAKTNLTLTAKNGGIAVAKVESAIEFHTVNGGVSLSDVGGSVKGETVNGGVSVKLAGDRWQGQGMDVATTNGGVNLHVPEQFSASLDIATVNGGMNVRLPNTQVQKGQHQMNVTVGAGGPLIRIRTTNGGVNVNGASAKA